MQMHLVMPAVNAKTSKAKTSKAKSSKAKTSRLLTPKIFRIAEHVAKKGNSPKREKTQ